MAEPHDLILERLKPLDERFDRTDGKIDDVLTEIRGLKEHQAGFMRTELAQDSRIAEILSRLDRLERRLDIREQ